MPEDENQLDTSTEQTQTVDTGSETQTVDDGDQDRTVESQPAKKDWRVDKYGDDWENNVQYWRDTSSYWRSETDKEKKKRQQPSRTIEDHEANGKQPTAAAPARPAPTRQDGGNGTAPGETNLESVQSVKDLVDYLEKQQESKFQSILSQREQESNFRSSMRQARKDYAGDEKTGIPSFEDLEQEFLIPLVQQSPGVLRILRELPDPGQAAYTLALMLKFKNIDGLKSFFGGNAREELGDKINQVSKEAVRVKGGKDGAKSGKETPEDIWRESKADFEKRVAKNTGRI